MYNYIWSITYILLYIEKASPTVGSRTTSPQKMQRGHWSASRRASARLVERASRASPRSRVLGNVKPDASAWSAVATIQWRNGRSRDRARSFALVGKALSDSHHPLPSRPPAIYFFPLDIPLFIRYYKFAQGSDTDACVAASRSQARTKLWTRMHNVASST